MKRLLSSLCLSALLAAPALAGIMQMDKNEPPPPPPPAESSATQPDPDPTLEAILEALADSLLTLIP